MVENGIPELTKGEIHEYLERARSTPRGRYPKILHGPGDEFNRVINFMMEHTYMQPHLHPGEEKIEKMYVLQGRFGVLLFSDAGEVEQVTFLEKGRTEYIEIPAFTWHTYVMLSEVVVSYETMMGKYDPGTWKTIAEWAPAEHTKNSIAYLKELKRKVKGIR